MNIRISNSHDFEEIKELCEYCFDDSIDFVEYYFSNRFKQEDTLVIEEDSEIIASLQMNQYKLHVSNKVIPTSYIVAISTLPHKRGRGLMKQLLPACLNEINNRGQEFALMMAIDSRLYERYQFSYICEQLSFNYKTADCKRESKTLTIEKVNEENLENLSCIYNKKYANYFIKLYRDNGFYKELKKELESEDYSIYLFKNSLTNEYLGYLIMSIQDNTINVREWCYLTKETLDAMLNFLYQHNMQASNVEIITANTDYLKHITPINKDTEISMFPFIMGRIINVEKFLKYKLNSNITGSVIISVKDKCLEHNNNDFELFVSSNTLTCNVTNKKPQVKLDINILTQLACGYLSLDNAIDMDLIKVIDPKCKPLLVEIFNKKNNYLNEYI